MRLSIITISFNAEECIERTIKSVLNQTLPIYEYIFVDGGSKDCTNSIIDSYKPQFEAAGIHVQHISEPDRGISDAFNKGIRLATGDLIGIINSDDELMPETNAWLTEANEKKPADIYYGNCVWVDTVNSFEYVSKPRHNLEELKFNMILKHPSTFVKADAYRRVGMFDISYKYCMDKELLYRMYLAGAKFEYLDRELTKFKAGGVSDKRTKDVIREGTRMARGYGEPMLKLKIIEWKKLARHRVASVMKKSSMGKRVWDKLRRN